MIPVNAVYKILKTFIPDILETYDSLYETRLKAQKIVYLFERLRNKKLYENSYEYSWYLAGPYSATLTHQIYNDLLPDASSKAGEWDSLQFTEPVNAIIYKLKTLLEKAKKINDLLDDTLMFELLASIEYIYEQNAFDTDSLLENNMEKIEKKLLINKPHFNHTSNLKELIKLVIDSYEFNI